ncbi:hypothetical protein OHT52_06315 [Streptomyces sp. NBC_00247]|uniref:hypothetical protein n=1 Tax=Streptomyces sp. NBC_00247 TaxID=2975689 RepID=UPI002E2AD649|nr:hypothetical protein [Streptomyces sp. NBC_00247]
MSGLVKADAGWVAIESDPEFGIKVQRVRFFEVDDEGVRPLVKNRDGLMVEPSHRTTDVIRATPINTLRITALRELLRLAGRATTQKQMNGIATGQALIMRGPVGEELTEGPG